MPPLTNPYPQVGRWLRGNIHTHTTLSDGSSSPQDVVDWYRAQGYDFLAITDHNKRVQPETMDAKGLLLIPGEELTARYSHLVGIGIGESLPRGESLQEQIDLVRNSGGLPFVCHPHWMGLTVEEIAPLRGHVAIELSNQVCFRDNGKGDSVAWWDSLLSQGHRCWGVAVDDCHVLDLDAGHGWLLVAAEEASWPAISTLEAGSFVASTGPWFEEIGVQGRTLSIRTCDCATIRFIGRDTQVLQEWQAAPGQSLYEAQFEAPEGEPFVRIEIADAQGRRAWTQPFWSE